MSHEPNESLQTVEGGVTAPGGYTASGIHCGLKAADPDLALLCSATDARVTGVFTTNRIQGAPVRFCRERLAGGIARTIVINSGNANACNGPRGMRDARRMSEVTALATGVDADKVFVCSTGTIGVPLPMAKIEVGIRDAAAALSVQGGGAAARAIMTTDTVPKEVAVEIAVDGRAVRVGGMAKGAGMIEPNMATMLAFLTTDAAVEPSALTACLRAAVDRSFNRVSIDGDQSCNDTVLFLANGQAENAVLSSAHPEWGRFEAAVGEVTRRLAFSIVRDGEGATKFVTVRVRGAASAADARKAARAVANSLLVKTSWFGEDPNWGRVIDAVGYSGAAIEEALIDIAYDGVGVVRGGCRDPEVELSTLEKILGQDEFMLSIHLNLGDYSDTVYTCDCSVEYVRINSDYTT